LTKQAWQDEEFLKQDCHEALGLAAAAAYCLARNSVADVGDKCDYSNILLPILEELQHFDYTHTFTGPFDVSHMIFATLCSACSRYMMLAPAGRARWSLDDTEQFVT
jgi:hypothetical protein